MSVPADSEEKPPGAAWGIVYFASILHALVVGITPYLWPSWWISHTKDYAGALKICLWFGFLLMWPLWAFPLWRLRAGRARWCFIPLVIGFAGLLPALVFLFGV